MDLQESKSEEPSTGNTYKTANLEKHMFCAVDRRDATHLLNIPGLVTFVHHAISPSSLLPYMIWKVSM